MSHIHQVVALPGAPQRIYDALTRGETFARITGKPAEIDPAEGGRFSCFGGMILGRHVELLPARRVVQAWRVANWEPGLYSIARFELEPDGTGTRVVFDHWGFPAPDAPHLEAGWEANYWKPLREAAA